jgi:hypothetical protein
MDAKALRNQLAEYGQDHLVRFPFCRWYSTEVGVIFCDTFMAHMLTFWLTC